MMPQTGDIMDYAILRTAKLKTMGNVAASASHNFRERVTLNADSARTHLNVHEGAENTAELLDKLKARLPDKLRKDGVLCIEYLMTASPEWWNAAVSDKRDAFFKKSREWLIEKHGVENVLYTGTQHDELTPHMVAYVVPIDSRGKMNCKAFLGGRLKLSEMQTSFAEKVSSLGLERGIKGSEAKHEAVRRHYAAVNEPPEKIRRFVLPEPAGFTQTKAAYQDVVQKAHDDWFEGYLQPIIKPWFSMATELQNKKSTYKAKELSISNLSKRDVDVSRREHDFKEIEPQLNEKKTEYRNLKSSIRKAEDYLTDLSEESQLKIAVRQIERQEREIRSLKHSLEYENEARVEAMQKAENLETELSRFKPSKEIERKEPSRGFDFEP